MLLYHFTSLRHGLSAIREQRLKISRFNTLNDPYDHIGVYVRNEDVRELATRRQAVLNEEGIICLSSTYKEPLLWGHYADNHKGMCLVFEVPDVSDWRVVDYVKRRPRVKHYGVERFVDLSKSSLMDIAHTKFLNWKYEKEVRRIVFLQNYDFADDFYYQKFDDQMMPRGALFGSRTSITSKQLDALLDHDSSLKYSFTKPAGSEFRVRLHPVLNKERIMDPNRRIRRKLTGQLLFGEESGF